MRYSKDNSDYEPPVNAFQARKTALRKIIVLVAIEGVALLTVVFFQPVDVMENGKCHTVFSYKALGEPGAHINSQIFLAELLPIFLIFTVTIVMTLAASKRTKL
jgi:hypothetical protein